MIDSKSLREDAAERGTDAVGWIKIAINDNLLPGVRGRSAERAAEFAREAWRLASAALEIEELRAENTRLRECIEDVVEMHAEHLADNTVEDGTYDYCDEEMAESRHQAATCALARAVWTLSHSREERERQRREVLERVDAGIVARKEEANRE